MPGSPILAAHAPKPFSKIFAVEMDPSLADALDSRMARSLASERYVVMRGDCVEKVSEIAGNIPSRSLTLAFIDPEGMDIPFEMLRTLAANRRVDFLLLFADAVDAVRNIDRYEVTDSKLDRMLGPDSGWRAAIQSHPNPTGAALRGLLPTIYEAQIKRALGYEGFRRKVINGPKGPLYTLIYASKHEKGLEFWDKAARKDIGGQRELFNP